MTVLKEGAAMADMGWLMGVMTLFFLVTMVGWIMWAWRPGSRDSMDAAARMPLEED